MLNDRKIPLPMKGLTMYFVKLTAVHNGQPFYLNMARCVAMYGSAGGAVLDMAVPIAQWSGNPQSELKQYRVSETPEQIIDLLTLEIPEAQA
jgi:hypothetical protein